MSKLPVKINLLLRNDQKSSIEPVFKNLSYITNNFEFIEGENPDFVMFFNYRKECPVKNVIRIFWAQEYISIKREAYDWCLGFEHNEDRYNNYLRFPTYVRYCHSESLIKGEEYNVEKILESKKKFCAFVYYNTRPTIRTNFFKELSKYKSVDAPGKSCNNIQPTIKGKSIAQSRFDANWDQQLIDFLKPYKFVISFSNTELIGGTDEKIVLAMRANTIPIYWGNPLIYHDFNPRSFINTYSYKHSPKGSMQAAIDKVISLDKNDNEYLKMLKEPWYNGNVPNYYIDPKNILDFFTRMFTSVKT